MAKPLCLSFYGVDEEPLHRLPMGRRGVVVGVPHFRRGDASPFQGRAIRARRMRQFWGQSYLLIYWSQSCLTLLGRQAVPLRPRDPHRLPWLRSGERCFLRCHPIAQAGGFLVLGLPTALVRLEVGIAHPARTHHPKAVFLALAGGEPQEIAQGSGGPKQATLLSALASFLGSVLNLGVAHLREEFEAPSVQAAGEFRSIDPARDFGDERDHGLQPDSGIIRVARAAVTGAEELADLSEGLLCRRPR